MTNLRRFFIYSFAAHVLFFAALLLLIPEAKETKQKGDLFTRLVSPEELLSGKPAFIPPSRARSTPHKTRSSSQAKKPQSIFDRSTANAFKQKDVPPANAPVQPGTPGQNAVESPAKKGSVKKQAKPGPALKDKLFDRGIIGDIAKRELEKEENLYLRLLIVTPS